MNKFSVFPLHPIQSAMDILTTLSTKLLLITHIIFFDGFGHLRAHVGGRRPRHDVKRRVDDGDDPLQAIALPRYASCKTHNYQIPLKYLKYLSPAKSSFHGTPSLTLLDAESMTCWWTLLRTWLVSCHIHFSQYFLFLFSPLHNSLHSKKRLISDFYTLFFTVHISIRIDDVSHTVKLISRIETRQQDDDRAIDENKKTWTTAER